MSSSDDDYGNPQRRIDHERNLARMAAEKRGKAHPEDGFLALVERIRRLEARVSALEDSRPHRFSNTDTQIGPGGNNYGED